MPPADGAPRLSEFTHARDLPDIVSHVPRVSHVSHKSTGPKLHPVPLASKTLRLLQQTTRVRTKIVQYFSDEELFTIHAFLHAHHSLTEWIAMFNDIAIQLELKPLFIGEVPEAPHEMTYGIFLDIHAHALTQNHMVLLSVMCFLNYIQELIDFGGQA